MIEIRTDRYYGLHAKYSLFLSDFNEAWISSTDFQKVFKYEISWKSIQGEPSCSTETDGRTDRHDYFSNAPKKMKQAFSKKHNIIIIGEEIENLLLWSFQGCDRSSFWRRQAGGKAKGLGVMKIKWWGAECSSMQQVKIKMWTKFWIGMAFNVHITYKTSIPTSQRAHSVSFITTAWETSRRRSGK
jgi:hypothetical protein